MKTSWSDRVTELLGFWTKRGVPEYRKRMLMYIECMLDDNPEWGLLDAGCGNGLVFKYLDENFRDRYRGIDFTPEMVEYCRNIYLEYKNAFSVCDLTTPYIPYGDLVITQNVIQHILPFQKALENLISKTRKVLLLCERTHNDKSIRFNRSREKKGCTVLVHRNPPRWRFNEQDFLDLLDFYGGLYGFEKAMVISRPKSTEGFKNVLSIYIMRKKGI